MSKDRLKGGLTCCKVRDVAENVENGHYEEGCRCCFLEGLDWSLQGDSKIRHVLRSVVCSNRLHTLTSATTLNAFVKPK